MPGEHRDERVGVERQAEHAGDRLRGGRPYARRVLRRVVRGELALVNGDEEIGLAERRERLEAHRIWALHEQGAGESQRFPVAREHDVGEGAEVGELLPARVEEREGAASVVGDRLARGRRGAPATEHQQPEEATEAPSSHSSPGARDP